LGRDVRRPASGPGHSRRRRSHRCARHALREVQASRSLNGARKDVATFLARRTLVGARRTYRAPGAVTATACATARTVRAIATSLASEGLAERRRGDGHSSAAAAPWTSAAAARATTSRSTSCGASRNGGASNVGPGRPTTAAANRSTHPSKAVTKSVVVARDRPRSRRVARVAWTYSRASGGSATGSRSSANPPARALLR
jgi:hypothetical protein